MADEQTHGGGGSPLSTLLILALVGAVLWLLSQKNARTWYLVTDDAKVVVLRGANMPFGRHALNPKDPDADAYAPIVPPPGTKLAEEQSFDSQTGIDQALFKLLDEWAKADVSSGIPERLARGTEYVRRAEKLPAISASQREELTSLEGESGYFEAQGLVERAAKSLKDAVDRLRVAANSRSPHATDAQVLLSELEPFVNGVLAAARGEAVRQPPPAPPAPPPAQPNTAAAPTPTPSAPQ